MATPTSTRSHSDGYRLTFDDYTGTIQLSPELAGTDGPTLILTPEDTRALADDIRKLLLELDKQRLQS